MSTWSVVVAVAVAVGVGVFVAVAVAVAVAVVVVVVAVVVVVVVVVDAGGCGGRAGACWGGYSKMKKSWRGVGGEGAAPPPNALVARNALQMSTWRSFVVNVVVVVVVAVVVVDAGACLGELQ